MSNQLSLLSDNPEPPDTRVFSVTELTRRIKRQLESGFSSISIEGEISNFKFHSSGHMYFVLKDSGATIAAVVWRSRVPSLSFTPEDGIKVIAHGRISVYEIRGTYQIDITRLRPVGAGELQIAFENLKRKLAEEGLFDDAHKVPLPEFPEHIGVVTSGTGAALQDILHILQRRFPSVEVILYPVRVQGGGAAGEIARAIREFNTFGKVDVLIVGRGGGSPEDLWAFNEEVVARAIYHSAIPVVSAVGHETDFTIADFVADLRAPTPSAAAELVVRERVAVLETLRNNWYHMHEMMLDLIADRQDNIRNLLRSYAFNRPVDLLRQYGQRIDELERGMTARMLHRFSLSKAASESLRHQLVALDPHMVLRRGYALVRRENHIISSKSDLRTDDRVDITFHDGTMSSRIT